MLYPLNPHGFLARILRFLLLSQGNQSWSLWSKKNVIGSISNIKATVVTCIMRPHDDRYSRKKRLTRNAWPSTFGLQFDPFHIVSFSPLYTCRKNCPNFQNWKMTAVDLNCKTAIGFNQIRLSFTVGSRTESSGSNTRCSCHPFRGLRRWSSSSRWITAGP